MPSAISENSARSESSEVVSIFSLSHSGSTLLGLLLGTHPRFVGLGEIDLSLRSESALFDRPCTCGEHARNCVFWGAVASNLDGESDPDTSDVLETILDSFRSVFGDETVPVESSKNHSRFLKPRSVTQPRLKVIHLLRDVRGYSISKLDNAKKKRRFSGWAIYYFWEWYLGNNRIQRFIQKNRITSLQIGYEELCLYPELIVPRICQFLNVSFTDDMLSMRNSKSHIIQGNRMRDRPDKNTDIRYDDRWFSRNEWLPAASFSPHIMRYNRREVYRNNTGGVWYRRTGDNVGQKPLGQ